MVLSMEVERSEAIGELALLLHAAPDETGEVRVRLRTGGNNDPLLRLGRTYHLDGEVAERLALIDGIANISLFARRGGDHLRLVA
jgi:DNA polymerase-3 subunit alpha